jgi:hypothetical protein
MLSVRPSRVRSSVMIAASSRPRPGWAAALAICAGCALVGYDPVRQLDAGNGITFADAAVDADVLDGAGLDGAPSDARTDGLDATGPGDAQLADTGTVGDAEAGESGIPNAGPTDGGLEECVAGTACDMTCAAAPGVPCTATCTGSKKCNLTCPSNSTCSLLCTNGAECKGSCSASSTCAVTCSDAKKCDMTCPANASCQITCVGNAGCSSVECADGAACLLQCTNTATCAYTRCNAQLACPDGRIACGRPCP